MVLLPIAAQAQEIDGASVQRGRYLAVLGDCTSCHTASGGKPFAGGFKINSPFGPIYGTNITPDPVHGIGSYSLEDFMRAVRRGIAKDGHYLYPAMPYPSFSKISDDDMRDLYAYFMHGVAPVAEGASQTHLPFPFNLRWGLRFWDWAFAPDKRFKPDDRRDAQWNRGAYLVQSLAHCGACHTPRGPAYEEEGVAQASHTFLHGGLLDNWLAPDLSGDKASGLGRWAEDDIANFLQNGHGAGTVAFGSMTEVIENSGQYMTAGDRAAIAHYLKSLKAEGEEASYHPETAPDPYEQPGAGLYANFCARCHGASGGGHLPRTPALAGNSAVLSDDATSVMRIVLQGGQSPQIANEKPARMPAFGHRFTDSEIAATVNLIRHSWGNDAPSVSPRQVETLRKALRKQ